MGRAFGPGPRMAAGRGAAGGAGRGGAHRCGPACAVRSGKARRGRRDGTEGDAGGSAARASIGLTARISRPRRACPSAPCATVGPEGAGTASRLNSEQDLALAIEPALPRRGGGRPPPSRSKHESPGGQALARPTISGRSRLAFFFFITPSAAAAAAAATPPLRQTRTRCLPSKPLRHI